MAPTGQRPSRCNAAWPAASEPPSIGVAIVPGFVAHAPPGPGPACPWPAWRCRLCSACRSPLKAPGNFRGGILGGRAERWSPRDEPSDRRPMHVLLEESYRVAVSDTIKSKPIRQKRHGESLKSPLNSSRDAKRMISRRRALSLALLSTLSAIGCPPRAEAVSEAAVDATLRDFYLRVGGSHELVTRAAAALVFPTIIKAGFGIGGE
jgi:hypothetical protein